MTSPAPRLEPPPLADLVHTVCALADELPPVRLLPGERMVLGGRLYREAPHAVRLLARALEQGGELFADVPLRPADLLERQRRALAYQRLARALQRVAQQAQDCYLVEQAALIDDLQAAVRQVRADRARAFPHPQAGLRALALMDLEEQLAQLRRGRAHRAPASSRRRAVCAARQLHAQERAEQLVRGLHRAGGPPPSGDPNSAQQMHAPCNANPTENTNDPHFASLHPPFRPHTASVARCCKEAGDVPQRDPAAVSACPPAWGGSDRSFRSSAGAAGPAGDGAGPVPAAAGAGARAADGVAGPGP
ncbi:MAG: hypothetical protein NZ890_04385 [Myxococcota bacterium]|nr:hypothetical protein [Myxococcota bacterium]